MIHLDQPASQYFGNSTVAGKPDLITMHPDGRATVYDVKTGLVRGARQSQGKLYMYLLPRVKGTRWYGITFDGCVVYRGGDREVDTVIFGRRRDHGGGRVPDVPLVTGVV